jgi:hypothetical protein
MLTQSDKANILRDFPNIKLSYETIIYKKVHNSDYVVAVPEGTKCFAWFTIFNEKSVCFIMELTSNNQIADIKITNACFTSDLAYGTILYGTVVLNALNRVFYIEDMFSYKGCDLVRASWGDKLQKMNGMLKGDLKQVAYNNSFIIFGLPLICKNVEELERRAPTINYQISNIYFMLFKMYGKHMSLPYKSFCADTGRAPSTVKPCDTSKQLPIKQLPKSDTVFFVRPEVQNDIYQLYCLDSHLNEEQHGIAHIPNFNTSAMMNKLFRNIKENDNLDALEESDDEAEFENESSNKFVHLDRKYKMICTYNQKFKKWCPVGLAGDAAHVITSHELRSIYASHEANRKYYKQRYSSAIST